MQTEAVGCRTKGMTAASRESNAIACVAKLQSLFDDWRKLDSKRLDNGTELIGWMPDEESGSWMHAVYHGLTAEKIDQLELELGKTLPNDLRAFYRWCNGMTLFTGTFRVFGRRRAGVHEWEESLQPDDLVSLNREIDVLGWKPPAAVAFAINAWDMSVHVAGMGDSPREILRCARGNGRILERHQNIFECIVARVTRLDDLVVE